MHRISIVSYLNSRPFIYGLKDFIFSEEVKITEDIPSACADKLINGDADIGLVPIAALPFIKNNKIISDYCISSNGEVKSVLLVSETPLKEIKNVLLDYQSRTSIILTKILFREQWKLNPEFRNAFAGYENEISGTTAGVIIGDRALVIRNKFKYVYDLSSEWEKMTSLPFVFACWVSTKALSDTFIKEFNLALSNGLSKIDEVVENEKSDILTKEDVKNYLKESIQFELDESKIKSMELFLKYLKELQPV